MNRATTNSMKSRRACLKTLAGGAFGIAVGGCATRQPTAGRGRRKVVVIGGGFGGATAAVYLRRFASAIEVTLVEADKRYATCPASNWVIGGIRGMDSITHGYDNLRRHGVRVIHARATDIDPVRRTVVFAADNDRGRGGGKLAYDRLIVAPGIDFLWDEAGAHPGYRERDADIAPHAWRAGAQTMLLRRQLEAMPDDGVFVICMPPNPFRCPPGPGERISLVAHYFKTHKPRAKIIAIDPKAKFSKQGLFQQGWNDLYPGVVEYRQGINVEHVDAAAKTAQTDFGAVKADVLNVIPAQKAGAIAESAGLTDGSGWCPVNHLTWESTLVENIHVIGDAAIQNPLPKSAYAANSEAKVCAAAAAALLNDRPLPRPSWVNTCYSLLAPDYGVSVAMVYTLKEGKVAQVPGAGGLSPKYGDRVGEAAYAESWYRNITHEVWG